MSALDYLLSVLLNPQIGLSLCCAALTRFAELTAEVRQHPHAHVLLRKVTLQNKPHPGGFEYLLSPDYYAQVKLFPLAAPTLHKPSKQDLAATLGRSLLVGQAPITVRPFPTLPILEQQALQSLNLRQIPSAIVAWRNRQIVADPANLLPNMPATYGVDFAPAFVDIVLKSYSMCNDS